MKPKKSESQKRLYSFSVRLMGLKMHVVTPKALQTVVVDTTVQEKAVAFPTDARLYHKARLSLVRMANRFGIPLRQSYLRKGKQAFIGYHRCAAARQYNRAKKPLKQLKTYLGRVIRDLERKLLEQPAFAIFVQDLLDRTKLQKADRSDATTLKTAQFDRAGDWSCENGVQVESKLSEGPGRRPDERHSRRLWLQSPPVTPASFFDFGMGDDDFSTFADPVEHSNSLRIQF